MSNISKKICIIGPNRDHDRWNIPLSFFNEFKRLGHEVKIFNNLNDDQPGINQFNPKAWTEAGLHQMLQDANNGVFEPDIIIHFEFLSPCNFFTSHCDATIVKAYLYQLLFQEFNEQICIFADRVWSSNGLLLL